MNKEQYKYMIIRQRDGTKILYYQREVQYVFLNQQFSGHVSINLLLTPHQFLPSLFNTCVNKFTLDTTSIFFVLSTFSKSRSGCMMNNECTPAHSLPHYYYNYYMYMAFFRVCLFLLILRSAPIRLQHSTIIILRIVLQKFLISWAVHP